ncbi:unnamed protein product [Paramecium sonneborni]|uniref:Uncharacterized protein n=1 Tax=Paramecium sonneborni TaxID=65129 RepID=A0A8S1QSG7_9CILI|nr:unnamed protein product [Paramecium sonneborni]
MSEKKNDFFSFFNGSQKKKETKKIIFDENYFNLKVNGGKIHSDKILIEAFSIVDNEKLETDIKWFQISPNNDFNTLAITGNQYQPSIEDVGSKFMIQVVPIKEGRQYEGMPKSMEIGPLQKDESIQEEIDELLENEKMTVFVTLEQILSKDFQIEAELPINCILKITLKNMELDLKENDQTIHHIQVPLQALYPSCTSVQGTDESFILRVDQGNHFQMRAADNSQRDIILTVIKGFYGKGIWKDHEVQQLDESEEDEQEKSQLQELEQKLDLNLNDEQQDQNQQQTQQTQILKEVCKEEITQEQLNQEPVGSIIIKKEDEEQQKSDFVQKLQSDGKQVIKQPQLEIREQDHQLMQNILTQEKKQEVDQEQNQIIEQNEIIQEQYKNIDQIALITQKQSDEMKQQVNESKNFEGDNEEVQQNNDQKISEEIIQEQNNQQQQQANLQQHRIDSQQSTQQQQIEQQEQQTKDIENKLQLENSNRKQSDQNNQINNEEQLLLQRSEQNFQSVIIPSEGNKEEKLSPIKKKEKKNNMNLYIQINENVKLKQDIEQYKINQLKDHETLQKQQKQIQTLTEQLNNCTKNYYLLEEECTNQKKIMHNLNDQKVFLQQDINMYKTQLLELTEVSSSQKEEISQLQKRLKRQQQSQDLNEAKKQIEQLKEEIAKKDLMLEAANKDHILAQQKIEDLEKVIEGFQNQLIHEKKKYESLSIEKGIKQPQVIQKDLQRLQFERPISKETKHVAQSMIQLDDAERYSIDISQSLSNLDSVSEVNRLKNQIMHLEATLRSLKIAYEQDIRYTKGKSGKSSTGSSKDIKYLQHIANNMAEIITEKDSQLENQKRINKELLTKLQILQQQQ